MSLAFDARIHDVTVPTGQNASRWIFGTYEYSDATAITIQSPAGLDAGTWTIEVSNDGTTASALNDGTSDIPVPAAGKARQYIEMIGFKFFRIKCSVNVAETRTFLVSKQWTV